MNIVIGDAILNEGLARAAVELARHPDRQVAFRISWGVGYAYFKDRGRFDDFAGQMVENYLEGSGESIGRIYGRIVFDLLGREVPAAVRRRERIAEKAFDLLTDGTVKVASKVWAMEILYLLCSRIGWVAENLAPTIEHQAALSPTPAMVSHANKVLRRLGRDG